MKSLITILLFLASFHLLADEMRSTTKFFSANKKFEFTLTETKEDSTLYNGKFYKTTKESKWSVINTSSKTKLYDIETFASQKTAFISDDGQCVIIVNDWPSEKPEANLEMVSIYNHGKLVEAYKLNEILTYIFNISSSVSHFSWTLKPPLVLFKENEIKFTTYELNDVVINIKTGEMSKIRNKNVGTNSMFVYGEIISTNSNMFEMKVCQKAFGILKNDTIKFFSKKNFEKKRYYSVLIENNKEVDLFYKDVNTNEILLNSCILKLDK